MPLVAALPLRKVTSTLPPTAVLTVQAPLAATLTVTSTLPAAAAVAAAAEAKSALPAEAQKALALQPVRIEGHMFELDQALKEFKFEPYTSKKSGKTYQGGKVERELEEVEETCDDFLTLAMGKSLPWMESQ